MAAQISSRNDVMVALSLARPPEPGEIPPRDRCDWPESRSVSGSGALWSSDFGSPLTRATCRSLEVGCLTVLTCASTAHRRRQHTGVDSAFDFRTQVPH